MNFVVVVLMVLAYSKRFIEEGALGHLFIDGSLNLFFHLSFSLYSLSGVCVCEANSTSKWPNLSVIFIRLVMS